MSRIYYAHLLFILQRFDEALTQGELAIELDPLNPLILSLYAGVLNSTGQFQKALDDLEKGYELHEPNMPYLVAGVNGFTELYDSTRFFAIVEQMNLPLPKK